MAIGDPHTSEDNVPTPIGLLPTELLIEIFTFCARSYHGTPLVPLVLSHVCQLWRQIVFSSPLVWQNISLNDRRSLTSMAYQSRIWLTQSKRLPVDIRVEVVNQDLILPMFLPLLREVHRWRRCVIIGNAIEAINFAAFSRNGSAAFIDTIDITIRGVVELQDKNAPHSPTFYPERTGDETRFPRSQYHRVFMRLSVLSLPDPALMSILYLRSLTIIESSIEVIPNPIRMLQFLQFCPYLEKFYYQGYPHEPDYGGPDDAQPPIVELPRLRFLGIKSTCAVRTVLSHIDAPQLKELILEHTNMEFEPSNVAEYPYGTEDGDSDDEAQDFSQSPWSDHATGMGLRSLIRRSNPPLEILAMDYADMRTKDFLWCFDRLPNLKEFRIVASDMSDGVMAMFAPFPRLRHVEGSVGREVSGDGGGETEGSNGDAGGESIGVRRQRMMVRMPKLTTLGLYNCQRVSGDAMVCTLQSRIRFTDRFADGEEIVRMSNIGIVGCADFLPRHAVNLSLVLGSRLRTFD
ncbi:hypothetical protein NLI96_g8171 [Meripilus lineatus]|uniref:F-box domain-containing protein n=1 Tax=Meripilus lineatus TaxID=2056292 RepID=A0AAD5YGI9_9APHY|nr:hypothetical protein NLI96_g8171 [Physisporinus lineatus]